MPNTFHWVENGNVVLVFGCVHIRLWRIEFILQVLQTRSDNAPVGAGEFQIIRFGLLLSSLLNVKKNAIRFGDQTAKYRIAKNEIRSQVVNTGRLRAGKFGWPIPKRTENDTIENVICFGNKRIRWRISLTM